VHDLENIGDKELVFMTVEFLDSANEPLAIPHAQRLAAAWPARPARGVGACAHPCPPDTPRLPQRYATKVRAWPRHRRRLWQAGCGGL